MAKTSFVLRALSLLGLEEILNLSEVVLGQKEQLKKAAGEELIVWNDGPKKKSVHVPEEAKILSFPKQNSLNEFEALRDPNLPEPEEAEGPEDNSKSGLLNSDLILWQREISKESGGAIKKLDAVKGYQKSTQMYVVKSEPSEGNKKLRFASTDGILVNKKQA